MRIAHVVCLLSVLLGTDAFAQVLDVASIDPGVGVKPFRDPAHGPLRATASVGYNAGLGVDLPVSVLERIGYSFGETEVAVSAMEATGSRGVPRKTFDEFDLLYGFGFEPLHLTPDEAPERFHISALAGIAFVDDQERYRRRFRGAPVDTTLPPNTFNYSFGLPVRLSATYEPFRFAGIGLDLFWTVSKLRPSYGAALSLQTGWF